ncbi:SDR family NAD(P)-dependent oxidoreductase [Actinoplanes sp. Pm04-4]|uniref:SDR family NAD(P)-dependent oxidoreductase n=1 Tax=Paractinoplanes pyxinae TaxID=2997416 RepID=A0ABT4ART7_9ACTN|nr:SDR family oxidoreductase [Actinoplanes pyxinae]MCY1136955.1 SDR family NAD(P)-dependent oxidoreductase [Actinoplanes pyxinae]
MTNNLAGRTAVVTGSTSGIGAAIAAALTKAGAQVVVSGRGNRAGAANFVPVDLAGTYQQIRDFTAEATDRLGGRVDILVNNAGIYPATATAALADDDLDAMLAVNVRAPHVLVGALAPAMAARGFGVIVNVGSWMSRVGVPFAAMYTATKAALEQMTRTWAAEFGPRGVRVNTVAPGVTLTPGNEAFREVLDQQTAGTPAGVVVRPQHIADGVVFLASDAAAMIHGTTLDIDGGIVATRLG